MRDTGKGRDHADPRRAAANDNPGSVSPGSGPGQAGAEARIDAAVMTLARLLGRQIAREEFERSRAANDNAPAGEVGDG